VMARANQVMLGQSCIERRSDSVRFIPVVLVLLTQEVVRNLLRSSSKTMEEPEVVEIKGSEIKSFAINYCELWKSTYSDFRYDFRLQVIMASGDNL
jgi:hypothetical protein